VFEEDVAEWRLRQPLYETRPEPLDTTVHAFLLSRMQRTHDRRRGSIFVGPAGIGKSTAIEAFRRANAGSVQVVNVMKRGVTANQVLQQLLRALRTHNSRPSNYISNASEQVIQQISIEIEHAGRGLPRDARPDCFPLLTIVFDEAQRLTNDAMDVLRGYNEKHYICVGTFPIGMIFVGNEKLSLEDRSGVNLLDEGIWDRFLFREKLSYGLILAGDIALFAKSLGVEDEDAIRLIVRRFSGERVVRSFRQIEGFIDRCIDEACGGPITVDIVRATPTL
jgi:MoxR-like ATPase